MSLYRDQLEAWLKNITVKADRVVDVGGAANPIRNRVKSFQTNEYMCLDLGVEEPKCDYIKFDINEPLEQLEGYTDKSFKYDCLFCLEVFEYVWNPVEAFRNINRLMDIDGTAYISFPAIYPVHNPVEIDYLRYTKKAIEKYLSLSKYDILSIVTRIATKGRNSLSNFYIEESMHPFRHSDTPFDIGYMVTAIKNENVKEDNV